jgi:hypothetical protein
MINRQLDAFGEKGLDLGYHIAVLRPTVMLVRQRKAVGDHQRHTSRGCQVS